MDGSGHPIGSMARFLTSPDCDRNGFGSEDPQRLIGVNQGRLVVGETREFEAIVPSRFTGSVDRTTAIGHHQATIARVGGKALYSDRSEYWVEAAASSVAIAPGRSSNPRPRQTPILPPPCLVITTTDGRTGMSSLKSGQRVERSS
jgi:Proline racemase